MKLRSFAFLTGAVFAFLLLAGPAKADYQVMVCAGGNQAKIPGFKAVSGGSAFSTNINCSNTDAYPDGDSSYMRIKTVGSGKVNSGYPSFTWSSPNHIKYRMINAYTREKNITGGWRHQLVAFKGNQEKVLVNICPGCKNAGANGASSTYTYAPRGNNWNSKNELFDRFRVRLICAAKTGCERSPSTIVDSNSFVFTMNDSSPPKVNVTPSKLTNGDIVVGTVPVTFSGSDLGAGVAYGQILVDEKIALTTTRNAGCKQVKRDSKYFARNFNPCPTNLSKRTMNLNTTRYADGEHDLKVCVVDYSGNRTCDEYDVRFLNTPIPRPVIEQRPNNPSTNPKPVFVFDGESVTTFYCRIDGAAWKVCPKKFKPKKLGLGKHTIEVYQIDQYGRQSGITRFSWVIKKYQCTLKKYNAKLTPRGLIVNMTGIRKRLVRLRLYPMHVKRAELDNPKKLLWGWRRTTHVNKNRRVIIRPYGFKFTGAIRKYVRKHGRAKLVVTVVNERKHCNTYNINKRTKVLKFTPKIRRGLGL